MKKNFVLFMCMLAAFSLPVLFTSCSDDDDDNGGSGGDSSNSDTPSSNAAVITTDDGEQLMVQSVLDKYGSGVTYTYNDQWLPTTAYCWQDYTYHFTYESSKALATVTFEDPDYGYDDEEYTFYFNSAGYISKMEVKDTYEDEYESGSGSGTVTYSYDSDGHLTAASGNISGKETDDGDTYSYTINVSATLTWTDGNITKYSKSQEEKESGYSFKETETGTFEYGSEENVYKQPTMAYSFAICELWGEEQDLMFAGLFGKGTTMLPVSYANTYEDNEDGYGNYSETYTYTKNDDKTIHTEVAEGGTLYTYTYATAETRSVMPEWTRSATGTTSNGHRSMLEKLRERRRAHTAIK